jgi:hypothetical protein
MRRKRKTLSAMSLNKRKIPISNAVYTLEIVKGLGAETGHAGECHFNERVIKIDADLDGMQFFRVLCHEIRHAHHGETGMLEILEPQAMEMDCQSVASLLSATLPFLTEAYLLALSGSKSPTRRKKASSSSRKT